MVNVSLDCDGFQFSFSNVDDAYVFDEKNPTSLHFHGGFMKNVDILVEKGKNIFFIEVKDYRIQGEMEIYRTPRNDLLSCLIYKFRDSYLYRFAEGMNTDKKIHYICLLELSPAVNCKMKKDLEIQLPVGKKGRRWQKSLAESCQILNMKTWNKIFQDWPVQRIS